jgi:hypothetical protein
MLARRANHSDEMMSRIRLQIEISAPYPALFVLQQTMHGHRAQLIYMNERGGKT